jgi:hypothetical protein
MKHSSPDKLISFVSLIVLQVLVIIGIETYILGNGHRSADGLAIQNQIQEQANHRLEAEIGGLRNSELKIKALFLRLNDAVYSPQAFDRIPEEASGKLRARQVRQPEALPPAIKQLNEAGILARPERVPNGESAEVYEAGSSKLELHRLIPVLAEQENSNAFLFLDRVYLSRPISIPPFSIDPTYLDMRLTVRILSAR